MNLRTLRSALPVSMATDGPTSGLLAAIARWTMRRCTVWQRRYGSIGLMACARCSWSSGGYSMDIGSVRPVFNGEGVDDCFYGMGECTATSFAWSTATQGMEAFPDAPLAANDLAALTTGGALISRDSPTTSLQRSWRKK